MEAGRRVGGSLDFCITPSLHTRIHPLPAWITAFPHSPQANSRSHSLAGGGIRLHEHPAAGKEGKEGKECSLRLERLTVCVPGGEGVEPQVIWRELSLVLQPGEVGRRERGGGGEGRGCSRVRCSAWCCSQVRLERGREGRRGEVRVRCSQVGL